MPGRVSKYMNKIAFYILYFFTLLRFSFIITLLMSYFVPSKAESIVHHGSDYTDSAQWLGCNNIDSYMHVVHKCGMIMIILYKGYMT